MKKRKATGDMQKISEKISKDFKNTNLSSKNLLKVLICGSHGVNDKKTIEELRDEVRKEIGLPDWGCFLLEDIKVIKQMTISEKFEYVWEHMSKGDNFPLCILYGGETAEKSVGLNVEIQSISKDLFKKPHSYIIKLEGIKLVGYAESFPNTYIIKNKEEFKNIAKRIIIAKMADIRMYLDSIKK